MDPNGRCIAHLETGGILLTADLRQSRILRRLHDRAQIAAGREVWPAAEVLPIDAWLQRTWREQALEQTGGPTLLGPAVLRWLWQREVSRDAPGLLDAQELGLRARASWLRLRVHGGNIADLVRWPLSRDQQAFVGWARAVERELSERGSWDGQDLARLLAGRAVKPQSGQPILLAGFRRLAPAQEALFAALAAGGRCIERSVTGDAVGGCASHAAADPELERSAMLDWLRQRFERLPDGIHALIIPDLQRERGAIERALASALQPSLELPGAEAAGRVFDLAGGPELASFAVIEAAFDALEAALFPVDWPVASRLLRSPHLAPATPEAGARTRAELALRTRPADARHGARALAARARAAGAECFAAALHAASRELAGPARRDAAGWAEAFGSGLKAWGWPGPLDSREYQVANRLRELLRELATLAKVAPQLEGRMALAELRTLASAPFQPESGEPAVVVLDAFDDPGLHFDSLWIAGLTASAWPRPAQVDPLLPIEVQRGLGMPGVTAEGNVAEARAIVERWRARAAELVLSWPRRENDTDVDRSPLVPGDAATLDRPAPRATRESLALAAARFEPIEEIPVPFGDAVVRGGARVLEWQSQCPFRAFAQTRLAAEPLEEPESGIDRRRRGIMLHHALQALWSGIVSQRRLAELDELALQPRIEAAVSGAIRKFVDSDAGPRAVELEREWQQRAVARLLELDRRRPAFTVVETERAFRLSIGGIGLQMRVDRVDRIGDELVVIDYKTGDVRLSAWRGARMVAPQLPLYAVLHPERPSGIAFAAIGASDARYLGVGRDPAVLPGLVDAGEFELTEDREDGFDWTSITGRWRASLEQLAAGFAAGSAEVDPKLGAETCRRCHLGALCRVTPQAPDGPESEAGTGD